MNKVSTQTMFWLLMGMFVFVVCQMIVPPVRDLLMGSFLFMVPSIIFSLLGGVLLFLTTRRRDNKFLLLTGISSVLFCVAAVLHNVFYALEIITEQIPVLPYLMKGLHVAFFFIAIPISPIGFLVGAVGTIVLLSKKRKNKGE